MTWNSLLKFKCAATGVLYCLCRLLSYWEIEKEYFEREVIRSDGPGQSPAVLSDDAVAEKRVTTGGHSQTLIAMLVPFMAHGQCWHGANHGALF